VIAVIAGNADNDHVQSLITRFSPAHGLAGAGRLGLSMVHGADGADGADGVHGDVGVLRG
jgi:hypothetical protein